MNDLAAFAKLVETLSPWIHQLVVVEDGLIGCIDCIQKSRRLPINP